LTDGENSAESFHAVSMQLLVSTDSLTAPCLLTVYP
jgi:hypothetical protein